MPYEMLLYTYIDTLCFSIVTDATNDYVCVEPITNDTNCSLIVECLRENIEFYNVSVTQGGTTTTETNVDCETGTTIVLANPGESFTTYGYRVEVDDTYRAIVTGSFEGSKCFICTTYSMTLSAISGNVLRASVRGFEP